MSLVHSAHGGGCPAAGRDSTTTTTTINNINGHHGGGDCLNLSNEPVVHASHLEAAWTVQKDQRSTFPRILNVMKVQGSKMATVLKEATKNDASYIPIQLMDFIIGATYEIDDDCEEFKHSKHKRKRKTNSNSKTRSTDDKEDGESDDDCDDDGEDTEPVYCAAAAGAAAGALLGLTVDEACDWIVRSLRECVETGQFWVGAKVQIIVHELLSRGSHRIIARLRENGQSLFQFNVITERLRRTRQLNVSGAPLPCSIGGGGGFLRDADSCGHPLFRWNGSKAPIAAAKGNNTTATATARTGHCSLSQLFSAKCDNTHSNNSISNTNHNMNTPASVISVKPPRLVSRCPLTDARNGTTNPPDSGCVEFHQWQQDLLWNYLAYLEAFCQYRCRHPNVDVLHGRLHTTRDNSLSMMRKYKSLLDDTLEMIKATATSDPGNIPPDCPLAIAGMRKRMKEANAFYRIACQALLTMLGLLFVQTKKCMMMIQKRVSDTTAANNSSTTTTTNGAASFGSGLSGTVAADDLKALGVEGHAGAAGLIKCSREYSALFSDSETFSPSVDGKSGNNSPEAGDTVPMLHAKIVEIFSQWYHAMYQFDRAIRMMQAFGDSLLAHVNESVTPGNVNTCQKIIHMRGIPKEALTATRKMLEAIKDRRGPTEYAATGEVGDGNTDVNEHEEGDKVDGVDAAQYKIDRAELSVVLQAWRLQFAAIRQLFGGTAAAADSSSKAATTATTAGSPGGKCDGGGGDAPASLDLLEAELERTFSEKLRPLKARPSAAGSVTTTVSSSSYGLSQSSIGGRLSSNSPITSPLNAATRGDWHRELTSPAGAIPSTTTATTAVSSTNTFSATPSAVIVPGPDSDGGGGAPLPPPQSRDTVVSPAPANSSNHSLGASGNGSSAGAPSCTNTFILRRSKAASIGGIGGGGGGISGGPSSNDDIASFAGTVSATNGVGGPIANLVAAAAAMTTGGTLGSDDEVAVLPLTQDMQRTDDSIQALLQADDVVVVCNEPFSCTDSIRLADRFQIIQGLPSLGEGTYGRVFRAWDDLVGSYLAAKEMPLDSTKKRPTAIREVLREYMVLTELKHPNIVRVVSFMVVGATGRIFMEWMPSGSLQDVLRFSPRGSLRENVVSRYTFDALQGLAYLHHRGVLHRDVKPANCLMAADGTVKLTDFGTSSVLVGERRTMESDAIMGTAPYMAPEAVQGFHSAATDIWALGCSVVELVTGRVPWADPVSGTRMEAIPLLFKIGSLIDDDDDDKTNSTSTSTDNSTGGRRKRPAHQVRPHSHLIARSQATEQATAAPGTLVVSDELMSFLNSIFVIDRRKRPSAEELLRHPFIQTHHLAWEERRLQMRL